MKNIRQNYFFSFFFLLYTSFMALISLKNGHLLQNKALLKQVPLDEMWKVMFKTPRSRHCTVLKQLARKNTQKNLQDGLKTKLTTTSHFKWIKKWGYGPVSYLFDYLDPVLQDNIVREFERIYEEIMKYSSQDTNEYSDPFMKKPLTGPSLQIFLLSANAVQLRQAMKVWKWLIATGEDDYAARFIMDYDINRDGRINARELILGAILSNIDIITSIKCEFCLSEIRVMLDALFTFCDCNNDGRLTASELWEKLPQLVRKTNRWDIFSIRNQENIRTSAINDFILKNGGFSKRGSISKVDFTTGVLLGYWDRQTLETGIAKDDSRNLKSLRWSQNGIVDTNAYNFMKEAELAKTITTK